MHAWRSISDEYLHNLVESMPNRCKAVVMANQRLTNVFDNVRIKALLHDTIYHIIIYKEMFLGCDWLIRVQLIPNITQNSAKICNTVQKSVTTVQKSVTTVQKSVTTVQKSVISSLSDGIYSLKNQKYGGRIFTFA